MQPDFSSGLETVSRFLPRKLLSRTAVLLSLVLGFAGAVDWMLEQRLEIHLHKMPWLYAILLGGLPLLASFRSRQTVFWSWRPRQRSRAILAGENGMFSHVMVGSNDIARSKKFYDALFGAIGGKPGVEDAKGRLIYAHNGGMFMVSKPIDGKAASHANGGTIGFTLATPEQGDAWHKAGVANGGTAIEDPPGIRPSGTYLAYLRDPDGNKLCALRRTPAA